MPRPPGSTAGVRRGTGSGGGPCSASRTPISAGEITVIYGLLAVVGKWLNVATAVVVVRRVGWSKLCWQDQRTYQTYLIEDISGLSDISDIADQRT